MIPTPIEASLLSSGKREDDPMLVAPAIVDKTMTGISKYVDLLLK